MVGGGFQSFITAVALTRCLFYTLGREDLLRVLGGYPAAAAELRRMAER